MKISKIFEEKNVVVSAEIFPPKKAETFKNIDKVIDELCELDVDYISVTYGALGNTRDKKTLEIAKKIKEKGIEPLTHLTCIALSKDEVDEIATEYKGSEIENVLALRGDIIGDDTVHDFNYASDLTTYLKDNTNLCIAGACYPEIHPECYSLADDINNLKKKIEAGAEFLVTQLFFDNNDFYYFRDKCRDAGINVPISVGLMPVLNRRQIERIASISHAKIPVKLKNMMDKFADNPYALEQAGIAYITEQIVDLLANGVDGIHLYIMNKPHIYRKIIENINHIVNNINEN